MHDKAALEYRPESGTYCVKIASTKSGFQAHEYIHNLLRQKTSLPGDQSQVSKIRHKELPPIPDAVPKAPHKTMGPPPTKLTMSLQKKLFKPKHWRNPYVEQSCVRKRVKEVSEAFEKLKLEHPTGRIKDACCAGVRPPIHFAQRYPWSVQCGEVPNQTNWIERNAIRAITEKPGSRISNPGRKMTVITNRGDKQAIVSNKTHSGLEKRYVFKPTYGKVPSYLKRRAEAVKTTREQYSHYLNETALQRTDYLLTEEERTELLSGLKTAWDKCNAKYLALSASNNNGKQLAHKSHLENQLQGLEKDIEMVETHSHIFVEEDKRPGVGDAAVKNEDLCITNSFTKKYM